jgi:hypothetical protein
MSSKTGSHDDDLDHPVKQPVETVYGIECRTHAGSQCYPALWGAAACQLRARRASSSPQSRIPRASTSSSAWFAWASGKDRARGTEITAKQAEIDKGRARITTIEDEVRRVVQELSPAT